MSRKGIEKGWEKGMVDALSVAVSGLTAQKQKLAVSANNIANATTGGKVPDASNPSAPASTVYRPLIARTVSLGGGGVMVDITEKEPGYMAVFDPNNPDANDMGLIAVPNVDYAEEFVKILETKNAFKANVAVIKAQDEMTREMLDELV
jgi:flagellar basal-body rod protein FlgC